MGSLQVERVGEELAETEVGVSASRSGPEPTVGDGGAKEEERDGWKNKNERNFCS